MRTMIRSSETTVLIATVLIATVLNLHLGHVQYIELTVMFQSMQNQLVYFLKMNQLRDAFGGNVRGIDLQLQ
eukprot:COSAG02_NODE_527_length_20704_cov_120.745462_12_plen_72_part_00